MQYKQTIYNIFQPYSKKYDSIYKTENSVNIYSVRMETKVPTTKQFFFS